MTGTGHDDDREAAGSGARSSWSQGGDQTRRGDAYGQRSGGSGGYSGSHALGTETQRGEGDGRRDASHDDEYRRWRDEQARAMDGDYASWRRERFSQDFGQWRAIRAAQDGLRTGSGPPVTHADRERELGADGAGRDRPPRADGEADH
jgi:hypothetical protein